MNIFEKQKNKGFTIVEAIIAVCILSISISAMLGLTVSSYSTAKYANNEITASYLLQEAIDSIRNSRDTAFQQKNWAGFKAKYADCFTSNGCSISTSQFDPNPGYNVFQPTIKLCNESDPLLFGKIKCPVLKYDTSNTSTNFYSFTGTDSNFKRQVIMKVNNGNLNEVEIIANVEYRNGTSVKTRSLKMYLLNWQAD